MTTNAEISKPTTPEFTAIRRAITDWICEHAPINVKMTITVDHVNTLTANIVKNLTEENARGKAKS
jgi:hypothetical protein